MLLKIDQKAIRARVIASYMREAGYDRAVCFTCGNAARALRAEGVDVLAIGPGGGLVATQWWRPEMVRRTWPGHFDATSGHLPAFLMVRIAAAMRHDLGALGTGTVYEVPTGSGETIMCLRMAYPYVTFRPVTTGDAATTWDDADAPLRQAWHPDGWTACEG